jgi:hypothetical protein
VRAETMASSDIENSPFNAINARIIRASSQGKGVSCIELIPPYRLPHAFGNVYNADCLDHSPFSFRLLEGWHAVDTLLPRKRNYT